MTAFVERKARKICRQQQQRRWPNKSVSLQKCQEKLAPGYHFRPPLHLRLLSLVFTQKKSSESWIILLPKIRSSSVQILAAIFQVSALPKDDGVQVWAPSQQRSSRILSWAPALKANRRTCGHWFHVKNPLKWAKRWTLTEKVPKKQAPMRNIWKSKVVTDLTKKWQSPSKAILQLCWWCKVLCLFKVP